MKDLELERLLLEEEIIELETKLPDLRQAVVRAEGEIAARREMVDVLKKASVYLGTSKVMDQEDWNAQKGS